MSEQHNISLLTSEVQGMSRKLLLYGPNRGLSDTVSVHLDGA